MNASMPISTLANIGGFVLAALLIRSSSDQVIR